jgi:hypothetical protein
LADFDGVCIRIRGVLRLHLLKKDFYLFKLLIGKIENL